MKVVDLAVVAAERGGVAKVARECVTTPQTIYRWITAGSVPAGRAPMVAQAWGLKHWQLHDPWSGTEWAMPVMSADETRAALAGEYVPEAAGGETNGAPRPVGRPATKPQPAVRVRKPAEDYEKPGAMAIDWQWPEWPTNPMDIGAIWLDEEIECPDGERFTLIERGKDGKPRVWTHTRTGETFAPRGIMDLFKFWQANDHGWLEDALLPQVQGNK